MIKNTVGKMPASLGLLLMAGIALGLRLFHIGFRSIWLDEAYSAKLSSASLTGIIQGAAMDIHPPLFHVILSFWMNLFGPSEVALRSLSALFGTLLVLVMYRLVADWSNRQAGWIAAFLVTVSPYFIELSRSGRMPSMLALLAALAIWLFWKFINNHSVRYGLLFSFTMLAALYTHYFAFLLLFACHLYIFIGIGKLKLSREKRKTWFWLQALLLAGYAPWITSMWNHISKGGPSWRGTGATLLDPLHSIYIFFVGTACWRLIDKVVAIGFISTAMVWILMLLRKQLRKVYNLTAPRGWGLMLTIIISVLGMVWIYSTQKINVFDNRYLSMVAICVIAMLAGVISMLAIKQRLLVLGLILIGFSIPIANQYFVYGYYDNWRAVAQHIEGQLKTEDAQVVIYPAWNETPLRYYLKETIAIQGLPGRYDPITGETEDYFYIDPNQIDQIKGRVNLKKSVFLILVNQGEPQTLIKNWFLTYYGAQEEAQKGSITFITLDPKELQ